MDMNSNREQNVDALIQQKSLLIVQAQFQQAIGQQAVASHFFLEAAVLEKRLAEKFRQAGNDEDAAISLFSAASCYKNANRITQALACATKALSLSNSKSMTENIELLRGECRAAAS